MLNNYVSANHADDGGKRDDSNLLLPLCSLLTRSTFLFLPPFTSASSSFPAPRKLQAQVQVVLLSNKQLALKLSLNNA